MQELASLGIKIPVDKSPAQRAKMKAYRHLAYIALFHAIMAVFVLINQNAVVTWRDMLLTFAGSGTLALMDAATKYVTAQGDTPLSTLLKLARPEVAQYIPEEKLSANQQALQSQFDNMVAPDVITTQIFNTPLTTSATVQPAVGVAYHPPIDGTLTINTLPNIGAVKPVH